MYHIKNDKRCERSAEAIAGGLETMLKEKKYEDITISDILRVSHVGRATFYRLFDNIDDVVVFKIDRIMRDVVKDFLHSSFSDFTTDFLQLMLQMGASWLNILSGRTDLVVHSIRNSLDSIAEHDLLLNGHDVDYRMAVFAGAALSLMVTWDERGQTENIKELTEILRKYLNYEALAELQ